MKPVAAFGLTLVAIALFLFVVPPGSIPNFF
jgi:hypothetical protein